MWGRFTWPPPVGSFPCFPQTRLDQPDVDDSWSAVAVADSCHCAVRSPCSARIPRSVVLVHRSSVAGRIRPRSSHSVTCHVHDCVHVHVVVHDWSVDSCMSGTSTVVAFLHTSCHWGARAPTISCEMSHFVAIITFHTTRGRFVDLLVLFPLPGL